MDIGEYGTAFDFFKRALLYFPGQYKAILELYFGSLWVHLK
jgi:hypothetical protein